MQSKDYVYASPEEARIIKARQFIKNYCKPWTEKDFDTAVKMFKCSLDVNEIAKHLGRTRNSVASFLKSEGLISRRGDQFYFHKLEKFLLILKYKGGKVNFHQWEYIETLDENYYDINKYSAL